MTHYALFKDGKQVSKAHSTREAAEIEAYERGIVWAHKGERWVPHGFEIGEVE